MTTEADSNQVISRYATAWLAGDMEQTAACYHNDVTLHWFGRHALSGDHSGKQAARTALAAFNKRTCRRLLSVESISFGPVRTAMVVREALGTGSDRTEVERVLVYRLEDNLIRDCWVYDQDQRLIDSLVGD